MVATVDKVFIDEFEGNIISLAQQRMSYLRSCVNEVSSTGKSHAWDRVGAVKGLTRRSSQGGQRGPVALRAAPGPGKGGP